MAEQHRHQLPLHGSGGVHRRLEDNVDNWYWRSRAGWAGDDETMRSYNEGVASESPSLWPYSNTAWPNMAQVKDSMGGAVYDTPKVVTVVAVPMTDVEALPAGQEQPLAAASATAATAAAGENVCLILVGVFTFFLPLLSVMCIVDAIVAGGKESDADVTIAAYFGADAILVVVLLLEVLVLVFSVLFYFGS
jgi:hypothetical protein